MLTPKNPFRCCLTKCIMKGIARDPKCAHKHTLPRCTQQVRTHTPEVTLHSSYINILKLQPCNFGGLFLVSQCVWWLNIGVEPSKHQNCITKLLEWCRLHLSQRGSIWRAWDAVRKIQEKQKKKMFRHVLHLIWHAL